MVRLSDRRRPSATTLAELLVTMAIFSLLLTAILSFYIQANKVRFKQDKRSSAFRRAQTVADRLETQLQSARIWLVDEDNIVYSLPLSEETISGTGKTSHISLDTSPWQDLSTTLALRRDPHNSQRQDLILCHNGAYSLFMRLEEGEKVSFSCTRNNESSTTLGEIDSVLIKLSFASTGGETPYETTRIVLCNNPEGY